MKPNKQNDTLATSTQSGQLNDHQLSQKAAAGIVRTQIENIYAKQVDEKTTRADITTQEYLRKYHSAWQDYYQKYYESYYTEHVKKQIEKLKSTEPKVVEKRSDEEIMEDLKRDLFTKIKKSSKKIRRSRHFIPIFAGVFAVLIFLFLQYNQIVTANIISFVSPGNISTQNIIIDPNTDVVVGPEPRLIIPKINVDVPVIYDIGNDYDSQMDAMTKGVAHFAIPGADSHPGQIGNTVLSGHSSNDLFDIGDYKFIFAQLDKLTTGDTIYLNYQSIRYTYSVTSKETVNPTDVNKVTVETTKPLLTLITCTPLGTSRYRLLVKAEQISPDPSKARQVTVTDSTKATESIPGNTKSVFERLFNI